MYSQNTHTHKKRWEEITKSQSKINEIEMNINTKNQWKAKLCFFKKINKIDKP